MWLSHLNPRPYCHGLAVDREYRHWDVPSRVLNSQIAGVGSGVGGEGRGGGVGGLTAQSSGIR